MIRQVAIILAGPIVIVALVALPVGLIRGSHQWLCAGVALALTVPPGVVALLATRWLNKLSPFERVVAPLVGMFLRIVVGFGGGVVVFLASGPTFRSDALSYWLWLLGAYLVTLSLEVLLLVKP